MRLEYLALYVVLLLLGMLVSAYKWQFLAHTREFKLSLRRSFWLYLTGTFLNNFFPSTIGGDAYRTLRLAEGTGRRMSALSTVFVDRLTGLWASLFLAVIFSLTQWSLFMKYPLWRILVLLSVMGLFFSALLIAWYPLRRWGTRLVAPWSETHLGQLVYECTVFVRHGVVLRVLFLAVVFNTLGVALANYILFLSFGAVFSFTQFASVVFFISVISSVPVSINNIGVKEWAYFTFFGFLGVNAEVAITVALVGRFMQMLISFIALPEVWRGLYRQSKPLSDDIRL
jgi:uncharacterized protein (TIRG00374 family)